MKVAGVLVFIFTPVYGGLSERHIQLLLELCFLGMSVGFVIETIRSMRRKARAESPKPADRRRA